MSDKVKNMFADIAGDYDRINSILSFGVHNAWRKKAVIESGAEEGHQVLDCATGTGDLAIEFKKAVGETGYVLGTDFCKEMIEFAPAKAKQDNLEVVFEVADAMNLPYENNRFDIASIAFGIRNVDDPVICLKEMSRVVKPGGKVVILEFGQPGGFIRIPYQIYSKHVMPAIGGWLSGNKDAYTYLPETSAIFASGEAFLQLMDEANVFVNTKAVKCTGGIAYIYVGSVK
ncbi:MAG: bifunctional demethylmenaquinone methyltransferase/2-methoxy-6-polyprenyl-1,4-benzoquinol methylase UbiE [Balneolaceae bacterium]